MQRGVLVRQEKLSLLCEELIGLQSAAQQLVYSVERCQNLRGRADLSPEQLERFESLTSRFARLSDLLVQRIFRLIDDIELTGSSSVLDRIYRAEKRGWGDAEQMIRIRELRNLIAHEYSNEKLAEIHEAVLSMSPILLAIVPKLVADAGKLGVQGV